MEITLKNIKYSEFASEETHCFEATVYVDGRRAFIATNDGHGGPNNYHPLPGAKGQDRNTVWKQVEAIDKELAREILQTPYGEMTNSLEIVIGDAINDWLLEKQIKKALRKICYAHEGEVYTLPAKHKPTPENLERVRKTSWWTDAHVLLNGKPLEEVKRYFRGENGDQAQDDTPSPSP